MGLYGPDGFHQLHVLACFLVHAHSYVAPVGQMHAVGLLEQNVQAFHQALGQLLFTIQMQHHGSLCALHAVGLSGLLLEQLQHVADGLLLFGLHAGVAVRLTEGI